MARYLLDTTVLIDHLRGFQAATDLLQSLAEEGHTPGICCVNVAELYTRMREHEQRQTDYLLDSLAYFEITLPAAKRAGRYRSEFGLSTADALIAAAAVVHGATLVTSNVRHYPMGEIALLELPSRGLTRPPL